MILERFDGIIFVGDSSLQSIYNALNILLRQDLAEGSLKQWKMDHQAQKECRCDYQFIKDSCGEQYITSSEEVVKRTPNHGNPYVCQRTLHAFLEGTDPHSAKLSMELQRMLPPAPKSNYKPVAIIQSLSPSVSVQQATSFLHKILEIADFSERKTPMLWIGPTAAGHIEVKGRKGNQEIWDFDHSMAKVARENDVEVLGMWNLTAQATSFDGLRFGEKVALTQAMMVINWLSRLESS